MTISSKVRMGLHTGEAVAQAGLYTGYLTLSRVQRVMSAGHGMQILLSGNTRELVQDSLPQATDLLDLGERRLKNNLHPEHLYQVALPFLMGKPNPQPRSSRIRTDLIKKFVKSV